LLGRLLLVYKTLEALMGKVPLFLRIKRILALEGARKKNVRKKRKREKRREGKKGKENAVKESPPRREKVIKNEVAKEKAAIRKKRNIKFPKRDVIKANLITQVKSLRIRIRRKSGKEIAKEEENKQLVAMKTSDPSSSYKNL